MAPRRKTAPRKETGPHQETCPRTVLTRLFRRLAAIYAEVDYAQHRLDTIRTNADPYQIGAGTMPETYSEFLFRTSGVLLREPAADRRARGRLVR